MSKLYIKKRLIFVAEILLKTSCIIDIENVPSVGFIIRAENSFLCFSSIPAITWNCRFIEVGGNQFLCEKPIVYRLCWWLCCENGKDSVYVVYLFGFPWPETYQKVVFWRPGFLLRESPSTGSYTWNPESCRNTCCLKLSQTETQLVKPRDSEWISQFTKQT